jgi:sugar phosphate isomerase/epimerase
MKFGVYNAILHDRSLPDAIEVIGKLGLTGIELNSGGFLPAVHIPTFDDILSSDTREMISSDCLRAPAWRLRA